MRDFDSCWTTALRTSALGLAVAACAAPAHGQEPVVPPAQVTIDDRRPPAERESTSGSHLITSCDFAVHQIGDRELKLDRVAALGDALNAAGLPDVAGRQLTLMHYGVYINPAEIYRRGARSIAFHEHDISKQDPGSRCNQDQMSGGWYGPGEATTRFAPIVVEIGVVIDGIRHDVRSVYSPDRDPIYRGSNPPALLAQAVRQAEETLVRSLQQPRSP